MARKPRARASGEATGASRFIAYYRVSTAQQGASGLGLEAQHASVARHMASSGGELIGEFQEVESGKRTDRPQLAAALAHAKATGATLIVAKLDRLARNAPFLLGLRDAGVDFIAADMPHANRLTVGVLALVAEDEREKTSERTKAALAAAKARGTKLGNPRLRAGDRFAARAAGRVRQQKAADKAKLIVPYIDAARRAGCLTLWQIAEALTARGVKAPGGGTEWAPEQVRRVIARAAT